MPHQLPLFPLNVVLFPGALLPLYIFEPRYRQLLADAALGPGRFGMVPQGVDGGLPVPGTVGCTALVRGVQPLPDGCSHIVVEGEHRFRLVVPVTADTPYHQGLVETFEDEPEVRIPGTGEVTRLRALAERYTAALETRNDQHLERRFSSDAAALSFEVAGLLETPFEERQRLLESRSVLERVTLLLHALPRLVEEAEQRARVHGEAGQNGHGALR